MKSLFFPILVVVVFLPPCLPEGVFLKTTNTTELLTIFLDNSERIKYAQVNITRTNNVDQKTLCCVNILGESTVCSFYDLDIEYKGKLISKSFVLDCPGIDHVDYYISYRFDADVIIIVGGILASILSITILVLLIFHRNRQNRQNRQNIQTPTASAAGI